MTALTDIIKRMIAEEGPMPLHRYMTLCLSHYYTTRDPFGTTGDFTTAPEISQVFGELIGVWVAKVWEDMGSPRQFALVELGPGRGTLMADVLRVLTKIPACSKAAKVHFVETSQALRQAQQERVPNATWHDSPASLPGLPTVLLANEFFDALPIRQFESVNGTTFEKCVVNTNGELQLANIPSPMRLPLRGQGIWEDQALRDAIATHLGNHFNTASGAALIIDYGYLRSAFGDTLQAMKAHQFCAVTDHVGEADITSHVDFESLGRAFVKGGAKIAGVMTQGQFLQHMGLEARTRMLASKATGEKQRNIITASERLANPAQMGELFKVMAVTGGLSQPPYPFLRPND